MPKIVEISSNFPCEVFINRHIASLYQHNYPVELLARQASKSDLESASVQEKLDFRHSIRFFPGYGHLSLSDVFTIVRQLFNTKNYPYSKSMLRDKVYLEFIRRLNPDLIHFHFGTLAGSMCWIAQELGIPYTLSLRGTDIQVRPLTSDKKRDQLQNALNHAAGVHTVCDSLWTLAKAYLNHEVFHKTIYTTVPITGRLPKRNDDELSFITVGRFHWRKNYVDLLKAFRRFLDTGVNANLVLIGDGPEKESLVYWISLLGLQNNITMTGKLNHDSLSEILTHSTAYIQSSIAEGFSNATAEAMALGVPVFATDVGGTKEIIRDGNNGFLLDPLQPDGWYEKMLIVKNVQKMENVRFNAWQTAKEHFSENIHASSFIDFYEHALHNRR